MVIVKKCKELLSAYVVDRIPCYKREQDAVHSMMAPSCCKAFEEHFQTVAQLGKGGQGIVMLCQERGGACRYLACKTTIAHTRTCSGCDHDRVHALWKDVRQAARGIVPKGKKKKEKRKKRRAKMDDDEHKRLEKIALAADEQLRWEAKVLIMLGEQPGILPLRATVESPDGVFHLLTPFCKGGNLQDMLDSTPNSRLSHQHASRVISSLARTLRTCHSLGFVHRDVKPENILFRESQISWSNMGEDQVLLADFGCAEYIKQGHLCTGVVGTRRYHAPELILGGYDHRVDIWSLGVVLHLLLTSALPFTQHLDRNAPASDIHYAILHNRLNLAAFDHLSAHACDLLNGMLQKDPNKRLSLEQVLSHPWIAVNNAVPLNIMNTTSSTSKPIQTNPCYSAEDSSSCADEHDPCTNPALAKDPHHERPSLLCKARDVTSSSSTDDDDDGNDKHGLSRPCKLTKVRITVGKGCDMQQWHAMATALPCRGG